MEEKEEEGRDRPALAEILDDGRVCEVEGSGVGGSPNCGGGHVHGESNQQRR